MNAFFLCSTCSTKRWGQSLIFLFFFHSDPEKRILIQQYFAVLTEPAAPETHWLRGKGSAGSWNIASAVNAGEAPKWCISCVNICNFKCSSWMGLCWSSTHLNSIRSFWTSRLLPSGFGRIGLDWYSKHWGPKRVSRDAGHVSVPSCSVLLNCPWPTERSRRFSFLWGLAPQPALRTEEKAFWDRRALTSVLLLQFRALCPDLTSERTQH